MKKKPREAIKVFLAEGVYGHILFRHWEKTGAKLPPKEEEKTHEQETGLPEQYLANLEEDNSKEKEEPQEMAKKQHRSGPTQQEIEDAWQEELDAMDQG